MAGWDIDIITEVELEREREREEAEEMIGEKVEESILKENTGDGNTDENKG